MYKAMLLPITNFMMKEMIHAEPTEWHYKSYSQQPAEDTQWL